MLVDRGPPEQNGISSMPKKTTYKWTFQPRFRRHAFGWRSQTPIKRIKESVSEIKKVARNDPVLAAEGAILFLEKISPAIEQVDSSSGAIGTAVNNAIAALVPVIAKADVDLKIRNKWLERLWDAVQEDGIPYIELLPDYWGELCVAPDIASDWADQFIEGVRHTWNSDGHGCFKGTTACFGALLQAERYQEVMDLLALAPYSWWHDRQWGVKALVAMGKKSEALQYAEDSQGLNNNPASTASACEEILLSSDMADEAYKRYAIQANQKTTYLATFRAIAKKYPNKDKATILNDLVASTPAEEGKWFAAAKSVGLFDQAIELANRTPCEPKTLTRAAKDMVNSEPHFAMSAGLTALRWLIAGYGYEITSMDVIAAYDHTLKASEILGNQDKVIKVIRDMLGEETENGRFVHNILSHRLGQK